MTLMAGTLAKIVIGLLVGFFGARVLHRQGYDIKDPQPDKQVMAWLAFAIFAGAGGLAIELADRLSR